MTSLPACVLPVLDLKGGRVVHAVAGRRSEYQPLASRWAVRADDPHILTARLQECLGISEYYLADLDALEETGNHHELICHLIKQGYCLWLDAGVRTVEQAQQWLNAGVHRLILASESVPSLNMLEQLAAHVDCNRLVFSLDLVAGKVRCQPGVFDHATPMQIVETILGLVIMQLIILDTAAVGKAAGPATLLLCQEIRDRFPECTIISGGGVRGLEDIERLQQSGVNRVLVSTWLHAEPTTTVLSSSAQPVR